MTRISAASAIVALFIATAPTTAQRPPTSPPQQTPTFRSSVDLVRLDVSVFDNQRRPVQGLAANDFTILENGVPQEIVVFDPVELPNETKRLTAWEDDVVPDVDSNERSDGRLWVLMLDDATAHPEMWAYQAVKKIARSVVEKISKIGRAHV